ncbi:RNA polymerase sigma factor [Microbacterium wangchenii]|uniref:RNA polymerase sigma factor n=1 Tax=Microbacterium wangchenii TaxID=2541726 RepID=UPI0011CAB2C3|nr:sigma-70 family RNA polymerase sigma factor [Microbacterium wangchenii]TXK20400.1 sigma-70 family RNA polymerase sigma factor [Microbacterium wangchenii]
MAKNTTDIEGHVRTNEHDLLRYFQRRIPNGADAAEAFGELLLTAWKLRRHAPADPTEGRMWLFAVAHNVLRDSRRRSARHSAAVKRLAADMRTLAVPVWDDAAIDVRDAIDRLKPDDAELIRLIYWDGFPSHAAARVLGINPSTARSRLTRAKLELRAALEPRQAEREQNHAGRPTV